MRTQKEIREAFWQYLQEVAPDLAKHRRSRKTQNDYCTDIRCMFCDYVENLRRDNQITEALCNRVTL